MFNIVLQKVYKNRKDIIINDENFSRWYINFNNNFDSINIPVHTIEIELGFLKSVALGFKEESLLNEEFSFNNRIKNLLIEVLNEIKVIEKKKFKKADYIKKIFDEDNITKFFYKRFQDLCFENLDFEHNIIIYYNKQLIDKYDTLYIKNELKIKKNIFPVQIFDKIIKLITKLVTSNSKYFFLNNVKYNYTLLKFCDKDMKLVNSILLFCLLCDINIPYYCFHSDLSIAGNCRMCLIQLDTSIKPIASCAVGINISSTIYTNTKIIQKAREGVLEFLLINHPLDCPICDQGGECDLQEQSMTYGNDRGRFLKKMI